MASRKQYVNEEDIFMKAIISVVISASPLRAAQDTHRAHCLSEGYLRMTTVQQTVSAMDSNSSEFLNSHTNEKNTDKKRTIGVLKDFTCQLKW
ncbi:hypothetical protein T265_10236 [Opisthorchis viverrini]|uniref:Uncharacterized protein n=1 Tax=Opisthorchis viverrini TaxID=6198 RepID=A0A075A217_OPIVI|nr:hypothetical protein T265_10236 [Opisthorchis viverrini]KER21449.1 hypothetical protein T265_10236 [Opisthorchis viverrini]